MTDRLDKTLLSVTFKNKDIALIFRIENWLGWGIYKTGEFGEGYLISITTNQILL